MSKHNIYGVLLIVDIVLAATVFLVGPKLNKPKYKIVNKIFEVITTIILATTVIIFLIVTFK